MAKVNIKMPEEFLLKVSKLADKTDTIIPKVLKAGAEPVFRKVKSNLLAVIGKNLKEENRSTGELADSLGISPASLDKSGNSNVKIGFGEPRQNGVSNAKIANIIEYGKSGQEPKPFMKPAKTAARKECIETMKQELERQMGNV